MQALNSFYLENGRFLGLIRHRFFTRNPNLSSDFTYDQRLCTVYIVYIVKQMLVLSKMVVESRLIAQMKDIESQNTILGLAQLYQMVLGRHHVFLGFDHKNSNLIIYGRRHLFDDSNERD